MDRPGLTDLLVAASKKEGYLVPAEVLDAATAAHCDVLNLGAWACAGAASVARDALAARGFAEPREPSALDAALRFCAEPTTWLLAAGICVCTYLRRRRRQRAVSSTARRRKAR